MLEPLAKSSVPFRFIEILQKMFHEVQARAECFENTMPSNSCVYVLSVSKKRKYINKSYEVVLKVSFDYPRILPKISSKPTHPSFPLPFLPTKTFKSQRTNQYYRRIFMRYLKSYDEWYIPMFYS